MKIYYAHCMALYNTPQEGRDLSTLYQLGFEVLNPNREEHQAGYKNYIGDTPMSYFTGLVLSCKALAFRALPDGSIPSSVDMEIKAAQKALMPVIELPSSCLRRALSYPETKEYLHEIGQR